MARPRGSARSSRRTVGARISATTAATMRTISTEPAARPSAHSPSSASGRMTSWIHRGTTTGATAGGGGSGRSGASDREKSRSFSGPASTGPPASTASGSGSPSGSFGSAVRSRAHRRIRVIMRAGGVNPSTSMTRAINILFCGDLVGGLGKRTLLGMLPALRERLETDFVVVNGENVAGGLGITPKIADQLFAAEVDVITLGNHTYRQREIYTYLDARREILRPANFLRSQPGHGWCVVERDGVSLGVISLSGNLFMDAGRPAFAEADAAVHALRDQADHILVDIHAEATSEKVGMGWHLDGRVTAVVGTHTHVPTADARVLPGGTAYITDVGMTGPRGGVIGVKREQAVEAMLTRMPVRFETSHIDPWLNGVVIRAREPMRAESIEQVLEQAPGIVLPSPGRPAAPDRCR